MVFPVVMYGCELDCKKSWAPKNWCFWTVVLEKTLNSPFGLQGDPISPSWRRSVLSVHWKDWCWSWNSNTLSTWWEELTHWKRPWCWERLRAGGEGDNRGWDGWMASLTWRTWVRASSGSWWWTGRPGVLQSMGSQSRTRPSNWTELKASSTYVWKSCWFNLTSRFSGGSTLFSPSAFFIVRLSHPYMTTGQTTALTRRTFVDKVMSLLFNMLSRLVITSLPRVSVF